MFLQVCLFYFQTSLSFWKCLIMIFPGAMNILLDPVAFRPACGKKDGLI